MKRKSEKNNGEGVSANKKSGARVVLVGTYKGDQLTTWRGWYNYPISAEDNITEADASKITELWLFKGSRDERRYKAEFVGVKTRQELIDGYGYPAKGKTHGDKYLLFKTEYKYRHKGEVPEDAERVIVRTADFATAPKVRKQLKAYLESSDRRNPDLAKRLPENVVHAITQCLRYWQHCNRLRDMQYSGTNQNIHWTVGYPIFRKVYILRLHNFSTDTVKFRLLLDCNIDLHQFDV